MLPFPPLRARRLLAVLFALSIVALSTTARADDVTTQSSEPTGYRQLVADALAEHEAEHFEEARALMLRAHALFPNARTLRGLGMVSFELREYAESVQQLTDALASNVRPLEGELREQTVALLARARSFVGRLDLRVQPSDARVLLDGGEVAANTGKPLVLSVGEHALAARTEGYLTEERTLRIVGGEQLSLALSLSAVPTQAQPSAQPSERRAWYKSPWFWVATGVLVAAGAATGVGLMLRPDKTTQEAPYRGLSGEPPLVGPAQ